MVWDWSVAMGNLHNDILVNKLFPDPPQTMRAIPTTKVKTASGESILLTDSIDAPFQGLKLFGKSTQDGTPSPENPVPIVSAGDDGQIEVGVYGGNLFDFNDFDGKSNVLVDVAVQPDGTVILTNLTNRNNAVIVSAKLNVIPGRSYICSVEYDREKGLSNIDVVENGVRTSVINNRVPFVAKAGAEYNLKLYSGISVYAPVSAGESVIYKNIRLNIGSNLLPYEPYTKQSLTYPTPNGLPGIPVSSGGNYTDESEQQWVCDEVDFGRGVYVKRVATESVWDFYIYRETQDAIGRFQSNAIFATGRYKSGKFESISNFGKWTMWANVGGQTNTEWIFALSGSNFYVRPPAGSGYSIDSLNEYLHSIASEQNPIVFIAQLMEIEEIPLEDSILSVYAALHTNYPTTTVMNDAGAWMEVGYKAVVKEYKANALRMYFKANPII